MVYKFRTPGPWGSGTLEDLDPVDIDNNFWQAIQDIKAKAAQGVGIDNMVVSGNLLTVVLTDHTLLGPYQLPVVKFVFAGEWLPEHAYLGGSIITHGGSTYFIPVNHTSEATFDPGANDGHGQDFYELLLQNATQRLDDLIDVDVTSTLPVQGGALVYDSGIWVPGIPNPGTLVGLTDVQQSPGPANGNLIRWNGSQWRYIDPSTLPATPAAISTLSDVSLASGSFALSNPLTQDDILQYNISMAKWVNYPRVPYNTWGGSNKTLQLDDACNYLNMEPGRTITIPTFASVPFPHNTFLFVRQRAISAAGVSIVPASGVTLNIPAGRVAKTRTVGSVVRLYKVGFGSTQDSWELSGDLAYAAFGVITTNQTVDISTWDSEIFPVTLGNNAVIQSSSAPIGARLTFVVTTSGTSSFLLQFGTGFKSQGNLATGTVSGKVFVISFIGDGTNMNEISRTPAM